MSSEGRTHPVRIFQDGDTRYSEENQNYETPNPHRLFLGFHYFSCPEPRVEFARPAYRWFGTTISADSVGECDETETSRLHDEMAIGAATTAS